MADAFHRASNEVSVLVPQVWSANFYDTLLTNLVFASVIDKSYEGEIANLGDTVKISSFPEFADANDVTEAQRTDAASITATQQSLVINKMLTQDFIVTNKAQLQSLAFVDKLRALAIYSIQKKVEALLIAATIPSAAAPDHAIGFTAGTTLTLTELLNMKELLDAQDIPMIGRSLIMGSAQLNDLFAITGFTSSDFVTSGAPLVTGSLPPALLGFAPQYTTGVGNTVYGFHSSYMTMAAQKGIDVMEYDMGVDGYRSSRINCTFLFGYKQLDNTRVVTIS